VGPLVGGILLGAKWSTAAVFLAAAAAALCAALVCFALGRLAGTSTIAQPTSFDAKLRPATKAGP